jgi:hypothetical protein
MVASDSDSLRKWEVRSGKFEVVVTSGREVATKPESIASYKLLTSNSQRSATSFHTSPPAVVT